jgi:hypothetical protein
LSTPFALALYLLLVLFLMAKAKKTTSNARVLSWRQAGVAFKD